MTIDMLQKMEAMEVMEEEIVDLCMYSCTATNYGYCEGCGHYHASVCVASVFC